MRTHASNEPTNSLAATGAIDQNGRMPSNAPTLPPRWRRFRAESGRMLHLALPLVAGQFAIIGMGVTDVVVAGTECVPVTLTFEGVVNGANAFSLTNPRITSEDGNFVGLDMALTEGMTVTLDTETGTATAEVLGVPPYDVTGQIVGDPFFNLRPGLNTISASSEDVDDNGDISICWRPAVISA